jgi:ubiquinone biosynthesis UbiH/UbiF/VisC/COQ6 family hydroxylase
MMNVQSNFDVLVVGAGPAGLSFVRSLRDTNLRVALIDPATREALQQPQPDGREIALTHPSKDILTAHGAWQAVPEDEVYFLRAAKVVDGVSPFELHFATPKMAQGKPTDTLGYLISNHLIRRALFEQVADQPNLTWLTERKVQRVTATPESAQVTLDDGQQLSAKLVVAADSRFSQTRQQMGIAVDMHDFGRTVITCRIAHDGSNQHTAFECFHYGRTLAILPLTANLSSAVITIDSQHAQAILDLSDDELAADLHQRLNGRLGEIRIASQRHRYPLVGTHARRFYSTRFALIGDAAVGMHPVTAHGFNLGLQSQAILAELVRNAAAQGADIGAPALLQTYDRRHQRKTRPIYHGTNLIVKLFTTEHAAAKVARTAVLRVSGALSPIKALISRQLTG